MKEINHQYYMRRALQLALKARGATSPNPLVGALLVKGEKIVGQGYHQKAGLPHAEVIAIDDAGRQAKGARLYLTLEPCAHFGRTPPCVDKIIKSGIREVFVAMIDPNPLNNGKGMQILKNHGIRVACGLLEEKAREINRPFIKYITKNIPFITVKVAQSLDGKIATKNGDSKWITSDKSRALAHRMRGEFDAIIVGVNTVLRDNPRLDAWFSRRHPVKVVVDSQLSVPQDADIFNRRGGRVIIVTLPSKPGLETENRQALASKAEIMEVKEKQGQINLKDMFKKLAQKGLANVLVEGGGTLIGSLFDDGLVDKVMFFISPKVIGGRDALGAVMGRGVSRIDKAVKLKGVSSKRIGDDFLIEGYV